MFLQIDAYQKKQKDVTDIASLKLMLNTTFEKMGYKIPEQIISIEEKVIFVFNKNHDMDKITLSFVKDFLKLHEIDSESEAIDFERFCNHTIVYNNYQGSFEPEDISTGDSAQGIDGIAIIVNGKLITSKEEIEDFVSINKFIEVIFVFIQAKTSTSFQGTEIGNFLFSVKDFFSETSSILTTPEIKNQYEISQ